MAIFRWVFMFLWCFSLFSTSSAWAEQEKDGPSPRRNSPSYLQVGVGWFDYGDEDFEALVGHLEWRFAEKWSGIGPLLGIAGTNDGALYGYGGLYADLDWGRFVVTPSFSAGVFEEGEGKDLGGVLEFRSALSVGWTFDQGCRIGAQWAHLSNADLYRENPGENELLVILGFDL